MPDHECWPGKRFSDNRALNPASRHREMAALTAALALCFLLLSVSSIFSQERAPLFGFFGDSLGAGVDLIPATAELANVHWVYADRGMALSGPNAWPVPPPGASDITRRKMYASLRFDCDSVGWTYKLRQATAVGHKVILDIERVLFFRLKSGQFIPVLMPEYRERFEKIKECLTPFASLIAAFYIFDEPYFSVASQKGAVSVSPLEISRNIDAASQLTKAYFPNVPTMVLFSYRSFLHRGDLPAFTAIAPASIDWFGFDCYLKDCGCDDGTVGRVMQSVKLIRKSHQKLVIVLDATTRGGMPMEQDLEQRNSRLLSLGQGVPVAAYLVFSYQNGLDHMPELRRYLKAKCREITLGEACR